MDKDDERHLNEYRSELKALKVRIPIMEKLISPLEAQEQIEGEVPIEVKEFDPATRKRTTTDDEVMNRD